MSRSAFLQKLAVYQQEWTDKRDVQCAEEFTRFVSEQPHCFERTLAIGHITASAWVVNPARTHVLLTHHRKLGTWLQVGGHCDGDSDTLYVALREAREESGIRDFFTLSTHIFDLDIHEIPAEANGSTDDFPAHLHYDVRYALQAATTELTVSAESFDVAWIAFEDIERYTHDASVLRMAHKWIHAQTNPSPALAWLR
jgi:8-oxo-dGTP pyrophosphatase MutT (NUDIX family)